MCGIAGLIGRITEGNRQAVRLMSAALAHRGPNGEGFFETSPEGDGNGVLLAHRRLSVLDLSNAAAQPMTDGARPEHTLVFNGEIYNYVDLRSRLQDQGQTFSSSGDTEVLLRALAVHGTDALSSLRGMFAVAHWDGSRKTLNLSRDPLGIKPLYICRNPDPNPDREWSILFASEVRAVLAARLMTAPRLSRTATRNFIWNGFVPGPETIVEGVELLPAGNLITFDLKGNSGPLHAFSKAPSRDAPKTATVQDVRRTLQESVSLHLASDVPLGVFLSGGIDSSSVANMAARASTTRVETFTLTFAEREYDEGPFAREIARAIGTHHSEVMLTEQSFISTLDEAMESMDQPTFDGLNSFYISRAVRSAGITVALLGAGGDELFGGYTTFRDLPRLQAIASMLRAVPKSARLALARGIARVAQRKSDAVGSQARWAKLPSMMACSDDTVQLYQLAYALFLPEYQSALLGESGDQPSGAIGLPNELRKELEKESEGRSALSAIANLEQRLFLGQRILRDTDAASMAVSLETRLPLVDTEVVDVISRLPDDIRFFPLRRKQVLRDIGLEGLDPALFERKKSGFQMPFDRWIRSNLGAEMDGTMRNRQLCRDIGLDGETVEHLWQSFQSGRSKVFWSRVWALYVLLRWCDRHAIKLH